MNTIKWTMLTYNFLDRALQCLKILPHLIAWSHIISSLYTTVSIWALSTSTLIANTNNHTNLSFLTETAELTALETLRWT